MILLVDVGNTNIVLGVQKGEECIASWRLSTDVEKTSDEYGIQIMQLFNQSGLDSKLVTGIIVSSVVPDIMHSLENAIRKCFAVEAIIVGPGVKTGINIKYDNPKEVGADRIVNAVAVHELYSRSAIIIDFGTATTFCSLMKNGDYLGGCIVPGIKISSDALFERAAKLPRVELQMPKNIICKNTVNSMQAGILYGYVGQVEYIVNKMKEEMKAKTNEEPYVVATGGLANLIHSHTDVIDEVNSDLTLEGLKLIYYKNKE